MGVGGRGRGGTGETAEIGGGEDQEEEKEKQQKEKNEEEKEKEEKEECETRRRNKIPVWNSQALIKPPTLCMPISQKPGALDPAVSEAKPEIALLSYSS